MCSTGPDCYFYFYSTCNKGKDCSFRHCELALGSETVCALWKEDLCVRENCKFRHMDCRYKRNKIQCYYEDHGGCRKPHCPFFHAKPRNLNFENTEGLILPVLPEASTPQPAPAVPDASPESNIDVRSTEAIESVPLSLVASPTSVPIEPVVVRLNDGEESDTESTTGSPMKKPFNKSSSGKNASKKNDEGDFVIKSWEQIRMEKIHRESDNFYKSVYDAPALESIPKVQERVSKIPERVSKIPERVSKVPERKSMLYPEDEYCIGDTLQNVTWDSSSDRLASSDLRDIIQQRKVENQLRQDFSKSNKRIISFKNGVDSVENESSLITITVNEQDSIDGLKTKGRFAKETQKAEKSTNKTLDFKIKSLDEIRKEKNYKISRYVEKKKRKLGDDVSENEKSLKSVECDQVGNEKNVTKLKDDVSENGEFTKSITCDEIRKEKRVRKLSSDILENEKPTKSAKCDEEIRKEKSTVVFDHPVPKPKVKRPARELYQVKPKEGLSPRKQQAVEESEVSKKIKLSSVNGIHSSSVEKKLAVGRVPSFCNESTKQVTSEIPGRRIVRLNRSKIFSKIVSLTNNWNSSDRDSEKKEKTEIESQSENKSSVLNSIRPFIRQRRKDSSKLACDESLSADTTRQSSLRSPNCISTSRRNSNGTIQNSSDGDLSMSNGVSPTNLNDQNLTYHDKDKLDITLSETTDASSSIDKKANQSSSSVDEIDHLLLTEAEGFISDMDSTEEKAEDIFFEIEQMLKS